MLSNLLTKIHKWFGVPYKLHVEQMGEGPIIIMLHGIATSSASWNRLVPLLSSRYQCITIDLVGFGKSPKPEWYAYTPQEHVASIHRTIKSLKLKEPYILAGHSMGSLLALHYASKYKEEVRQLIMLSPPVYFTKEETKNARIKWRQTLHAKAYQYIRQNKELTLKGARRITKLPRNKTFEINEDTWLAFSRSLEECIEKQNVIEDLEQIACPVNIFYGTLDQLIIKSNIQSLTMLNNISIHTVRNGHVISKRYASAVASKLLNQEN